MIEITESSKDINEIDGLPRAYFDLTDGENTVRIIHQVICYKAETWEEINDCHRAVMADLREMVANDAILIWRRRPEVTEAKFYMRLAISPPCPEFFEKHGCGTDSIHPKHWPPT